MYRSSPAADARVIASCRCSRGADRVPGLRSEPAGLTNRAWGGASRTVTTTPAGGLGPLAAGAARVKARGATRAGGGRGGGGAGGGAAPAGHVRPRHLRPGVGEAGAGAAGPVEGDEGPAIDVLVQPGVGHGA